MKRMLIIAGVVLAVLVAAVVGTAYWSGRWTETQYRALLAQGELPPNLRLNLVDYRRGWWVSQARLNVELTMPQEAGTTGNTLVLPLQQTIYHGPLPVAWWLQAGGGSMQPMLAVVRTVLAREGDWVPPLVEGYGGREPLEIVTHIQMDGASTGTLTMPPLTLDAQGDLRRLDFAGAQGRFQVAAGGRAFQGDITLPRLELAFQDEGEIKLNNLLLTANQQQGRFGLWLGSSDLKLAQVLVRPPQADDKAVTMSGLTVHTESSEEAEFMTVATDMAITQVALDGEPLGDGRWQISARRLDGATLARLQQWNEQLATGGPGTADWEALQSLLRGLLQQNPQVAMTLEVRAPKGPARVEANVTLQDADLAALMEETPLLLLAEAQANIRVAKPLLEEVGLNFMVEQAQEEAEAQGEEPPAPELLKEMLQQQLAQFIQMGFIRAENDAYTLDARFQPGRLTVNGKEVPLPTGD